MSNFWTHARAHGQLAGIALAALLITISPLKGAAAPSTLARTILEASAAADFLFYGEPHIIREPYETILATIKDQRFDCFAIEATLPQQKDRYPFFEKIIDGDTAEATYAKAFPGFPEEMIAIVQTAQQTGKKIISFNRRPNDGFEFGARNALSPKYQDLLAREVAPAVFERHQMRVDQLRAAMMAEALETQTRGCKKTLVMLGFYHAARTPTDGRLHHVEVRDLFARANPEATIFSVGDLRVAGHDEGEDRILALGRALKPHTATRTETLPVGPEYDFLRRFDIVIGGRGTRTRQH